ncbi:hypothetical protein ABZP36_001216 [Zizania latifolia]
MAEEEEAAAGRFLTSVVAMAGCFLTSVVATRTVRDRERSSREKLLSYLTSRWLLPVAAETMTASS